MSRNDLLQIWRENFTKSSKISQSLRSLLPFSRKFWYFCNIVDPCFRLKTSVLKQIIFNVQSCNVFRWLKIDHICKKIIFAMENANILTTILRLSVYNILSSAYYKNWLECEKNNSQNWVSKTTWLAETTSWDFANVLSVFVRFWFFVLNSASCHMHMQQLSIKIALRPSHEHSQPDSFLRREKKEIGRIQYPIRFKDPLLTWPYRNENV